MSDDTDDIFQARESGRKAAKEAVEKGFKGFSKAMKECRDKEQRKEQRERMDKYQLMNGQQSLDALNTAIREFVWAEARLAVAILRGDQQEIAKQQEQSTRMDTSMREQLEILNMRVLFGQAGGILNQRRAK